MKSSILKGSMVVIAVLFISYFIFNSDEGEKSALGDKNSQTITSLYPIQKDGLFGFINQSGTVIIEPSFARVISRRGYNKDELIPVIKEKNGKVGFIDYTGTFIIPPTFEAALPFQEGKAMVIDGGKVGYIDELGNYIVEASYSIKDFPFSKGIETLFFSEDLAPVQVEGKGWGYINSKAEMVIEPQYEFASAFKGGLAAVKQDGLYGFINKAGELVIDHQFTDALPFSEELAVVKINKKYGYINKDGKIVIEPTFTNATSFKEGLAAVFNKITANGGETELGISLGFINKEGEIIIPFDYEGDEFTDFSFKDGLAIVRKGFSWGYINKSGEVAIPLNPYDQVNPFSKELALVSKDGRQMYINTSGEIVYAQ